MGTTFDRSHAAVVAYIDHVVVGQPIDMIRWPSSLAMRRRQEQLLPTEGRAPSQKGTIMDKQKPAEPPVWILANCGQEPKGQYKELAERVIQNIIAQMQTPKKN